jgi:methoxymalonate biosynthesis acyl carrier protein
MLEIRTRIKNYLSRFFPGHELRDDEDIFQLGFVTSMFALQLIQFLEQEFPISVDNEDLELDNFRSIDAMTRFIEKKAATPEGAT